MMALDLGLHKSATGQNFPLAEHERRVRVFWNIFVYEKVLACEMGRPVLIRMVHCDPVRLSEEQADEYEALVGTGVGTSRYGPVAGPAVRLHVRPFLLLHLVSPSCPTFCLPLVYFYFTSSTGQIFAFVFVSFHYLKTSFRSLVIAYSPTYRVEMDAPARVFCSSD